MTSINNISPKDDVESGTAVPSLVILPPEPEPALGLLKPLPETTMAERTMGGVGLVATATAIGAMIAEVGQGLVVVAGLLSILTAGYAYYQETALTDIKALRETRQSIQVEVDRLEAENRKLGSNIDEMAKSLEALKDIEDALEKINALQGKSVTQFREQVNGYKDILASMERNLKGQIIGNILSVITRSDTDQDFMFSASEVQEMIRRINNIAGVRVNQDLFREKVTGKSVHAAMDLVDLLFQDNVPEQERIFILDNP